LVLELLLVVLAEQLLVGPMEVLAGFAEEVDTTVGREG
jgi:hypothetical protein